MNNNPIIFGFHSIEATILHSPQRIERIFLDSNRKDKRIERIVSLAMHNKIEIEYTITKQLNELSNKANHQGFIARLKTTPTRLDLTQLLNNLEKEKSAIILILDGITDPHNLGAIVRTADCFGVSAIILPKNNSANSNNPVVAKVSSGAINNTPIITVNNLVRAMEELKEHRFWIAGTHLNESSTNLFDFKAEGRIAWVMGSESTGIRRLVTENCDYLITIPMLGATQSLNVSVATGVVLAYTQFMQLKN